MIRSLLFAGCAASCACTTAQAFPPLTVAHTVADLPRHDGHVVTIRGWLDECKQLSCGLFQTQAEARAHRYGTHMLSIGSTPDFDRVALNRGPAEVVIRGKIDATCRGPEVICLDRAPELIPFTINFVER